MVGNRTLILLSIAAANLRRNIIHSISDVIFRKEANIIQTGNMLILV